MKEYYLLNLLIKPTKDLSEEEEKELADKFYKLDILYHYTIGINLVKRYWEDEIGGFSERVNYFLNLFGSECLQMSYYDDEVTYYPIYRFQLKYKSKQDILFFVDRIKEYFNIEEKYIAYTILKMDNK